MPKRLVLVHDCGHIVRPGETLNLSEDPERNAGMYNCPTWLFSKCGIGRRQGTFMDESGVVYARRIEPKDGSVSDFERSLYAVRFDCTVMEIDDGETPDSCA